MSTLTIEELVNNYKIPLNPIELENAGEPLKYELLRSSGLKIDSEYQRLISAIAIQSYGKLNRDLLATTLVSRRPESLGDWSGDFIFDGQHKGIMHYVSGIETDDENTRLPCQVKVWPEGMSLEEIRQGEAKLFIKHNSERKNPTKVDIYRSGVLFGDPEALKIETMLKNLNLVIDGFGSTEDGAITLKVPNPFFRCVLTDLETKHMKKEDATLWMRKALKQYEKTYFRGQNPDTFIHGQVLRTFLLVTMFAELGLTNGRQKKFKDFLDVELLKQFNSSSLIKNHGGFTGPRYILHDRIINTYNTIQTNIIGTGAQTILKGTLAVAVDVNDIFQHPDKDDVEKKDKKDDDKKDDDKKD